MVAESILSILRRNLQVAKKKRACSTYVEFGELDCEVEGFSELSEKLQDINSAINSMPDKMYWASLPLDKYYDEIAVKIAALIEKCEAGNEKL